MKTKVRALKKLYFFENRIVRYVKPNEYVEVENALLQKFLKWKAVEIVGNTETAISSTTSTEKENTENQESEKEETENTDIVAVIEKMDSIKNKSELIEYGNHLGIDNLTVEMTKEEIKAEIVNGLEENHDI